MADWKSVGPEVAEKRGNACGAKKPRHGIRKESTDMSRLPMLATTEESGSIVEVDLGVYAENRRRLSPRVWQLQQKLYVKAARTAFSLLCAL